MNLTRPQNIFIGDGTAFPANDAAITSVTSGKIGIYGMDMKALDPSGVDTMATQPAIFIVEGKTGTSDGVYYPKRSMKIDGAAVTSYKGTSYTPAKRETWSIGYSRSGATGLIEVNNDTDYTYAINFKNDKWLYSQRPENFRVTFHSAVAATQLTIATQITNTINNGSYKILVSAVTVGDGTGLYGLTGASNYGVEITAKDVDQFLASTYTQNIVYFSVSVNDATGFGPTTTCTEIQAFTYGSGTYNEVYEIENKNLSYEGVLNRRLWPIPIFDYSSSATYLLSSAIAETVTGTSGEDKVTFSATVAAKIRAGEKVELGGVNYEIKYFVSITVAILTSTLVAGLSGDAVKIRFKYDLVTIEFEDSVNTPTGVVAKSNKSVIIAVPSIDSGGAYNSTGAAAQDVMDILNTWMPSTPRDFAVIAI